MERQKLLIYFSRVIDLEILEQGVSLLVYREVIPLQQVMMIRFYSGHHMTLVDILDGSKLAVLGNVLDQFQNQEKYRHINLTHLKSQVFQHSQVELISIIELISIMT